MNYDIIGDIHGHYYELTVLLKKMGYQYDGVSWGHPDRRVLFVGDYIDRGPMIPQVIQLVQDMTKNHQAIALMGNHELNAILFNQKKETGGYVREHSIKNWHQHSETLSQFNQLKDADKKYAEFIEWSKALPMYFENEHFRAIHATWHPKSIELLEQMDANKKRGDDFFREAGREGSELYEHTEIILKGIEIPLPDEVSFIDKDGTLREEARIKWWKESSETQANEYIFGADLGDAGGQLASDIFDSEWFYAEEKPVFFGHYWLRNQIQIQSPYVCCLDYSIGKKDRLVAYRYSGERVLSSGNFVQVGYGELG